MKSIKEILKKYKNIALVGASKDLTKTSSIVMKYLQDNGFRVYPVNPSMKGDKILGEKVFGNIETCWVIVHKLFPAEYMFYFFSSSAILELQTFLKQQPGVTKSIWQEQIVEMFYKSI